MRVCRGVSCPLPAWEFRPTEMDRVLFLLAKSSNNEILFRSCLFKNLKSEFFLERNWEEKN